MRWHQILLGTVVAGLLLLGVGLEAQTDIDELVNEALRYHGLARIGHINRSVNLVFKPRKTPSLDFHGTTFG